MIYKVPQLSLNGVFLPQQDVKIKFTAGAFFNTFNLIVPNDIDDTIKTMSLQNGEISLKIVTYNIQNGIEKEVISNFERLWLLRREKINPYLLNYTLADNRYYLKGKVLNFAYNITLQKNAVGNIPLNMGEPGDLKQDFDIFKKGRYALWSIKDKKDAYTMMEILENELSKLGMPIINNIDNKNSYILENIEVNNQDVYIALNNLLKASRLNLGINNDGIAYIFSLDKEDPRGLFSLLTLQQTQSISSNIIYRADNSRIRPRKTIIKYLKLEECFLVYNKKIYSPGGDVKVDIMANIIDREQREIIQPKIVNGQALWTEEAAKSMRIIGVENVLPLPRPINFDGKEHLAGEWFPLQKYLYYLGISDKDVRENWFAERLSFKLYLLFIKQFGSQTRETLYTQANYIANIIKTHYLQTFIIDPYIMTFIDRIYLKKISIIDNYTGYSPLSSVYSDYTIVPHLRNPRIAKRLENWNTSIVSWNIEEKDPYRSKETIQYLTVLSSNLGIFQIKTQPTVYSPIQDIIPFKLKVGPARALGENINNSIAIPAMLDKCVIDEKFEMLAKIGVVWKAKEENDNTNSYNSEKKYYIIEKEEEKLKAEGNPITKYDPTCLARITLKQFNDDGSIKYDENTLIDKVIIDTIAKGYNDRINQQYRDYLKGKTILAGYVNINLFGNITSVLYEFSIKNGTNTTYETMPYIPYSIDNTIDQKTLNFIHKHLLDTQLKDN
jgi:hypothetical protein